MSNNLSYTRLSNWAPALGLVFAGVIAACSSESSTSSASVSAIDLSPSPCSLQRGDSKSLGATATLPDGTKRSISSDPTVTWTSDNTNTITVQAGTIVGVSTGVTKITAAYQGATGTIDCTVTP